jgi:PPOX class probable F420-dependent enzyme
MQIDTSTEFGARVVRRLQDEIIIWLTTVAADGTPAPRPVWFLWTGTEFLIYSQPRTAKLRHLGRDPRVALHFNSDDQGGNIVVFTGTARVDAAAPPADREAAYLAKYRTHIQQIGMTPESFARAYAVAIRVTPEALRGH